MEVPLSAQCRCGGAEHPARAQCCRWGGPGRLARTQGYREMMGLHRRWPDGAEYCKHLAVRALVGTRRRRVAPVLGRKKVGPREGPSPMDTAARADKGTSWDVGVASVSGACARLHRKSTAACKRGAKSKSWAGVSAETGSPLGATLDVPTEPTRELARSPGVWGSLHDHLSLTLTLYLDLSAGRKKSGGVEASRVGRREDALPPQPVPRAHLPQTPEDKAEEGNRGASRGWGRRL